MANRLWEAPRGAPSASEVVSYWNVLLIEFTESFLFLGIYSIIGHLSIQQIAAGCG